VLKIVIFLLTRVGSLKRRNLVASYLGDF